MERQHRLERPLTDFPVPKVPGEFVEDEDRGEAVAKGGFRPLTRCA